MWAFQETKQSIDWPRKPPDGERMAAGASQQTHLRSYTHSDRHLEDGASYKQNGHGCTTGGQRQKAEQPTDTHQYPQKRYSNYTKGLANGRARCWCSCGLRRLGLKISSLPEKCRTLAAPAATAERDGRLLHTSSSVAGCTGTSGTRSLATYLDETASRLF